MRGMSSGQTVDVGFLDNKAFDIVPSKILTEKMTYGLDEQTVRWNAN